jgi:hypothetical protein
VVVVVVVVGVVVVVVVVVAKIKYIDVYQFTFQNFTIIVRFG